jgi:hypothetical protein
MDRKEETRAVKKALVAAGYTTARVKHGTGTAWGWLKSYATLDHAPGCTCVIKPDEYTDRCQACRDKWHRAFVEIQSITIKASGRTGYSAECVNVHLNVL